ncbi:hypothetical protein M9H77_11788 [Catharanthus roseus]|uniref:Uncharacterized protein n=1 Tax=Catharanthus roseus TaxID=4058 RepID=A0ACC0BFM7_CATRO|nr:hypothetical protein M9H77_11788 [Catharanthus roseus]
MPPYRETREVSDRTEEGNRRNAMSSDFRTQRRSIIISTFREEDTESLRFYRWTSNINTISLSLYKGSLFLPLPNLALAVNRRLAAPAHGGQNPKEQQSRRTGSRKREGRRRI